MPTKVKFCGITRLEDAEAAIRLDAWAIGLNLWEGSSRFLEAPAAAAIAAAVKRRVEIAGIFVNPALRDVEERSAAIGLTLVQLHGDEGPQFCGEVARRTGCPVIKAVRVGNSGDVRAADAFSTAFHLFDSRHGSAYGGTGKSFDWGLLRGRRRSVPAILAGGLDPVNVGEAVTIADPFAVDVSTGVESSPGVKDEALMEAFSGAVREAGASVGA